MKKIALFIVLALTAISCMSDRLILEESLGLRGSVFGYNEEGMAGHFVITNLSDRTISEEVDFRIALSLQERTSIWGQAWFEDLIDEYKPLDPRETRKISFEESLDSTFKRNEFREIPFRFIVYYRIGGEKGEWKVLDSFDVKLPEKGKNIAIVMPY